MQLCPASDPVDRIFNWPDQSVLVRTLLCKHLDRLTSNKTNCSQESSVFKQVEHDCIHTAAEFFPSAEKAFHLAKAEDAFCLALSQRYT